MNKFQKFIIIKGAKENNLKNIDLKIPKNKLVVFTGVSGSGKSSLAFNTIYEEGRRRYIDSLSSYARQFLGGTQKPLVDSIEGLSPAISIEQKTIHNNPRSTVGTVTEIYDYLRLLFARLGKPYCPNHKIPISAQHTKDIVETVLKNPLKSKIIILSPIVKKQKGTYVNLFEKLKKDGFLRVKVDDKIYSLDDEIKLEKNIKHNIDIVVDRIFLSEDSKNRINDAIELALEYGKGFVKVEIVGKKEHIFSKFYSCPHGDFDMPLIDTRLFSFNSPIGMCPSCKGLGVKLRTDVNKLMPNKELTINQGGILFFKNLVDTDSIDWQQFKILLNHYGIDLNTKIKDLTKKEINIILHGSEEEIEYVLKSTSGNKFFKYELIEGIGDKIERRYIHSSSEKVKQWFRHTFLSDIICNKCNGYRLNKFALAVKINQKNIYEFTKSSIDLALEEIMKLKLTQEEKKISNLIINELFNRLSFLNNVGLDYLTLNRKAETLSGGESQRIRLATQIGSNLTGVLYVLDEPSIGLHQKDNLKLIQTLKHMVEIGNTLIVVEHDEETIKNADYIVDIGPFAGEDGGSVVATGTVLEIMKHKKSITADFLSKREQISLPSTRRSGNGKIFEIKGASENNLKNIDVKFPLGKLIAITGVSGSGKSTLINSVLTKSIQQKIMNPFIIPGKHRKILGIQHIDKIIKISQSPIGRTPRSNPATYTSLFDDIRDLFANVPLAKARGYTKSRFSFNVPGGRCEKCRGDGVIKIEMHFLPDVYIKCNICDGSRYNSDTLDIKYKQKNIFDILNMRVSQAHTFFENHSKIKNKLKTIIDVGLGYIKLGQNAITLSGGEAQRVKLATFLQKKPTGKTIFVLDEPTTGLHQYDVKKLIKVFNKIVDGGDTIIVIEHNLDVIKVVDYIIDLGPDGGKNGGKIVASGTPEQLIAKEKVSYTGKFLKTIIQNEKK